MLYKNIGVTFKFNELKVVNNKSNKDDNVNDISSLNQSITILIITRRNINICEL